MRHSFPLLRTISMCKKINAFFGAYTHVIRMIFLGLITLSFSRFILVIWQYDRVASTDQLFNIFLQGLRADVILMCIGAAVPVAFSVFWANRWLANSWFKFTYAWCLSWLILVLFLELSTPSFIMQFDTRPDRLYIEYLKYPKEVFSTLWMGFRLPLIGGTIITLVCAYGFSRWLTVNKQDLQTFRLTHQLLIWPLAVFLIVAGIRSTTQHRPANPAMFAITSDALVNSLVINSGYSVLYAIYNLKHEARSSELYGKLSTEEMLQHARAWPWEQERHYQSSEYPTLHWQKAAIQREKPLNIVIVLQESMGASFVGALNGKLGITPELEKLKEEGIWFENLYATGTRSVRGIEAVVAGYAPTPAQSTVKLSNSQSKFTTIASIVKNQGYFTQFIYGGEAHFDNMQSFFTGNGFTDIVDLKDIASTDDNGLFVGSWGASDEDLFEKAHFELQRLHAQGQPFLSLIFTSSNHQPYEFPDNRIVLHEQPAAVVNNAVKYADWAMGQFFEQAKKSPYWQDTVFLIVADHDSRAYGSNLIPLENFQIPGLILGADVQPQRLTTLASQIDLAPTLLSFAGISACHTMTGRDLMTDATSPGRALIQYGDLFALMEEDNELTILKPKSSPVSGQYHKAEKRLTLSNNAVDPLDYQKALAHVQLPSYLYREKRYRNDVQCVSTPL